MGPQAFSWHILKAALPPRYRPPNNVLKYSGEMNPGLWLEDYRLACRANGTVSDNFIIRNLPMFQAYLARTWLEGVQKVTGCLAVLGHFISRLDERPPFIGS